MEKRKLGSLSVSLIGMGTWNTFNVRGQADEAVREQIVRTAFEAGSTFYDSSPMYGEAERVLGQAVKPMREQVMIATKVWTESDEKSEQQFAHAFDYFGGYVDLYQVHNLVAWQRRLSQLEELKAQNKVKVIGVTDYRHAAFDEMAQIMQTGRIEAIQVPYNALDRVVEKRILPLAASLNIGVVVMRPFGEGALVKRSPTPNELARFAEYGVTTWPQILLKWLGSDSRVSVIIPATSKPERMAENAVAGDASWFDEKTRNEVSRLAANYS